MDKVVDHLLVFKGNGDIKDFPGNYTQFREWQKLQSETEQTPKPVVTEENKERNRNRNQEKKKLSYKEKLEYERLEKEISQLEAEQRDIEQKLCSGELPIDKITEYSIRLPILKEELDEKSMRWLELSEI